MRARRKFRVRKVQNILHANFFMLILLISNRTVFLEAVFLVAARAISAFLKNSLEQINSKLNSKPYDYLY